MLPAAALIHGDPERWLRHAPEEHPLALQLGGSEPAELARAVDIACPFGFEEINLNVGCPSDRVQSGRFGACLMREPSLVADCVAAMIDTAAGRAEITVKCRIGVDDQVPADVLPRFIDTVAAAGVRWFSVHARMAWLDGLSPKENRTIPPLDHALVHRMKLRRPELGIAINGGIGSLDEAEAHLAHVDGVMIGRAAYQDPTGVLASADRRIFKQQVPDSDPFEAVRAMYDHIEGVLAEGGRLHQVTRHMLGAFSGCRGARKWRRELSDRAREPGAGIEVIEAALGAVAPAFAAE